MQGFLQGFVKDMSQDLYSMLHYSGAYKLGATEEYARKGHLSLELLAKLKLTFLRQHESELPRLDLQVQRRERAVYSFLHIPWCSYAHNDCPQR